MERRDVLEEERRQGIRMNVDVMRAEHDVVGLADALRDEDPLTRQRAALALGTIRDGRAVDPLIGALGDEVSSVRESAADSLALIGEPAVVPLIEVLEYPERAGTYDRYSRMRRGDIAQHDLLGGPEAARGRTVEHEDLPQHDLYGGPAGVEHRTLTSHPEEGISQHDLLGGPEGIPPDATLEHRERPARIGATYVQNAAALRRVYAAAILGEIGDTRAVDPLARALRDPDVDLRCHAGGALSKMGGSAVEPLVRVMYNADKNARIIAAGILGDIRDSSSVEPLIATLADEDDDIRGAAAGALVQIGTPAVDPLISSLRDANKWIRLYSAGALGFIGDTRAIDPLKQAAAADSDNDVRSVAQDAVEKIRSRAGEAYTAPPVPR